MSKLTKTALIMLGAGAILCVIAYFMVGGDWTGFNSKGGDRVARSYESKAAVTSILIEESANEINVVTADTDKVTIDYYDEVEKPIYEITEENGKLVFTRSGRPSFRLVNIDFSRKDVTITIPSDYKGEFTLELASGSFTAKDVTASKVRIENTSGSVVLTNVTSFGDVDIENTSGSVEFTDLKADGDISIGNVAGSVEGSIDGSENDFSITSESVAGSSNLRNSTGGRQKLEAGNTAGSIEVEFTK